MRYKEKEKIKETALQLYLQGKNFTQIARELGTSRNYISSLLKADLEKMFEDFRVAYKGRKRSFKLEFENFVKKNKEWREIVPKLMPALVKMEEWRIAAKKAGKFVPEYAMLQTWINQSRWEVEYEDIQVEETPVGVSKGEYGVGFGGIDY